MTSGFDNARESEQQVQGLDRARVAARLEADLAEIDARIRQLTKPPERGGSISFGKRVGEGTTEAIGRFTDVGIANDHQAIRERLERALAKLEAGSYGICDECGEEIAPGRLEAAPESATCIACARSAR